MVIDVELAGRQTVLTQVVTVAANQITNEECQHSTVHQQQPSKQASGQKRFRSGRRGFAASAAALGSKGWTGVTAAHSDVKNM